MVTNEERFVGCLLGVAIGDALGAPFEKMTADQIAQIPGAGERYFDGSINPDPFPDARELRPGQWTDDTQLTLAVAKAFLPDGKFVMNRMAGAHVEELAAHRTRGWGGTTLRAVQELARGVPWTQSAQKPGGGNGVMMKIAPLGLVAGHRVDEQGFYKEGPLVADALTLGRMTHGHPGALLSGVMQAIFIAELMTLKDGDVYSAYTFAQLEILNASEDAKLESGEFTDAMMRADVLAVRVRDERMGLNPQLISAQFGGGAKSAFTAWNSLGTAYTCFLLHAHNAAFALRDAVRCGGDTDSNASIVGALLGVLHGPSVFPPDYLEALDQRQLIERVAQNLYAAASQK